jgi:DNA-binding NarL/FixJ family response regulator
VSGDERRGPAAAAGTPLTVAVVDDHPLYRSAVTSALTGLPDLTVALECGSVEELEAELDARPGAVRVVLLDLRLPGRSGADAVTLLTRRGLDVLVLSASTSDEIVDIVAAGARGYLTKAAEADEIRAAVRAVGHGGGYLAPDVAADLSRAVRRQSTLPMITPREREVLELVAAGLTDRMIAERLTISVPTVRSHLDRIRAKTGSRRRADLTLLAVNEGFVSRPGRR